MCEMKNESRKQVDQHLSEAASELADELRALKTRLSQLEELIEIHRQWLKFNGKLFPDGCAGKSIERVDLVSLDSFTAGCISVFLERGRLDDKRVRILRSCESDLEAVTRVLNGYAEVYYRRLRKLASAVLGYIDRHS
jgi:hypothetical protein